MWGGGGGGDGERAFSIQRSGTRSLLASKR